MNEVTPKEEVKAEKEQGHFVRAAFLAASRGFPEEEIRELRWNALWQISAVYRNGPGTKKLAEQYGFSKKEVREILEKYAEQTRRDGDEKSLEPCYDQGTGKYLSFEEWMERLLRIWDKLPPS